MKYNVDSNTFELDDIEEVHAVERFREKSMDVVEKVPFGVVAHAFELRFNHLLDPDSDKTFLQLVYKFGLDEEHYKEYEVLLPTFEVAHETIESTLQA